MSCSRKRIGAVEARFLARAASHQTDRQEWFSSVSARSQGNAAVEVRAGTELDIFLAVLHPVQDRDIGGTPRSLVTSSTQSRRPLSASWLLQIANIGVVELAEVDLRPSQTIVPPMA